MKKIVPLEKDVQHSILEFLSLKNIKAWRTNSGMVLRTYKGKSWMQRFAPPGTSDIIGLVNDGRLLAIEVKRPGGKPSDLQVEFLADINKRNGIAFVATSIEDVVNSLKEKNIVV